ncbi:hypothetical protein O9929_07850 [Vibrio lentus]|nr:hypothetical protein [Vibrio lentus]
MFDAFYDVEEKAKLAMLLLEILQSWADAGGFTAKESSGKITVKVFKVTGETNTTMTYLQRQMHGHVLISLSTQSDALKMERDGITPDEQGGIWKFKYSN